MIKKRKIFFNYEKEEKWLNKMAEKGLNLTHYSFAKYGFEKGIPGEYIYRTELLDLSPAESEGYIKFMEESGVEHVDRYGSWAIFRKKSSEGPFEIFSDYHSRIKHYWKVVKLLGLVTALNLFVAFINITTLSNINTYVSILNWSVVILFTPVILSHLRNINKLNKEKELFDK